LQCSDGSVTFAFTDSDLYDAAQSAWSWVGGDNIIFAVLNHAGCGSDSQRHPYNVTQAQFGDNLSVTLTAVAAKWPDVLGSYQLLIGAPSNDGSGTPIKRDTFPDKTAPDRRDTSTSAAIPINKSFANDSFVSTTIDGVKLGIGCNPCQVQGGLNVNFTYDSLEPSGTATISPSGLSADLAFVIDASGTIKTGFSETVNLITIPLDIPAAIIAELGVSFGPSIAVDATIDITNITAEIKLSLGASISVPDDSTASLHVLDFLKSSESGWNPTFHQLGPTIEGEVSASATIFPTVALQVAFTVPLFPDFAAGVALLAPQLTVSAEADASTSGSICGSSSDVGVSLKVDAGGAVQLFGGKGADVSIRTGLSLDAYRGQ